MKIVFLCKRHYMGKDVIRDRYGRLYEIPWHLSRAGHQVQALCLDYRGQQNFCRADEALLHWSSLALKDWRLLQLPGYPYRLLNQLRGFRPDVVLAASDIPHIILGAWLARRLKIPLAVDLYDNFESFGQARLPGFVPGLRRAIRQAALVTTTSAALGDFIQSVCPPAGRILPLPSSVDTRVFYPMSRQQCRKQLGLPLQALLVGTAGNLTREKGIDTLYQAWMQLATRQPDTHLVLAGPRDPRLPLPCGPRVHDLGLLPHARVAELFAALDVGVMCIRDSAFGHYCFPQKAYEMLACQLPVVTANIGAMATLFAGHSENLYQPGDAGHLAQQLEHQLKYPSLPPIPLCTWQELVTQLEHHLRNLPAFSP